MMTDIFTFTHYSFVPSDHDRLTKRHVTMFVESITLFKQHSMINCTCTSIIEDAL